MVKEVVLANISWSMSDLQNHFCYFLYFFSFIFLLFSFIFPTSLVAAV